MQSMLFEKVAKLNFPVPDGGNGKGILLERDRRYTVNRCTPCVSQGKNERERKREREMGLDGIGEVDECDSCHVWFVLFHQCLVVVSHVLLWRWCMWYYYYATTTVSDILVPTTGRAGKGSM